MTPERVLIVTYLFPPSVGVGVQRFVSYARYLPQSNCEPFILTVRKPATPVYDLELAKTVPPETRVYRAFNPELSYDLRDRFWKKVHGGKAPVLLDKDKPASGGFSLKSAARWAVERICRPDVQRVWVPFAIRAARKIIHRDKITTVLVNLPPYSCLQIAIAVRRYFPNIRLILDFRDEWIDNYFTQFDTTASDFKLRYAIDLERQAVEAADFVSAVTRTQAEQIRARYPAQPAGKFIFVPNGFEPELYRGFQSRPSPEGRMVVTHFGSVYANPAYRPILNYLDMADDLPEAARSQIETRSIGRIAREAAYFFEGRRHPIKLLGFMSKAAGLQYLQETSYNLIVSGNPTSHGGKLFDYLGSGKPILALCPLGGELAQVIRETNAGWCVEPEDRPAIRELILRALDRFQRPGEPWTPNWDAIREYEWPNLIARMARLTGMGSAQRP